MENKKKLLDGRVVVVTGATKGLGKEVAIAYAKAGATVVLLGRNIKLLERVYDEIVALGCTEPFAITLDLYTAVEHDFEQMVAAIEQEAGKLDGIVHCAGYFYALSPLVYQTVDEWMGQYRVNTVAPMVLSRACLPLLSKSDDASIIFVSESHAQTPKAYWGAFGASYAAVNYLGKVAADEWSNFSNLRVNVIEPGNIHSPLRIKTHPGESQSERKSIESVLSDFLYWMGPQSKGRSGEIIKL